VITNNNGRVEINYNLITTNVGAELGFVDLNLGTITTNTGDVDTFRTAAAAALAAYNSTGVAKEASVGAIATILTGITSLAHWLRGLYNKRTMNSAALAEIQDTTGTFDPTTDSNEAIRDKLPANLEDLAIVDTVGTVAVPDTQKVDVDTIKTKAVAASNTVTFANGTVAISGADGDTLKTISDQIDGVVAGSGLTAQQTRDAMKLAPSNGAPIAGSIDAKLDAIGAGAGAIEHEVTITNAVGTFISDVDCWVYTEAGMVNLVASGKSDALGAVTFWLDAGTYYIKCQKSGVNFSNPTAFTVI